MKKYPFNEKIKELSKCFASKGYSLYLVGGAVRDFLLKKKNDDYDFTTDALPEEIVALFPGKTIPTGIKHGTVTVLFKGESYEITTFRTEGSYTDSRHPDNVTFVRSLEEDLKRRDFTINAFAADTKDGHIIDLHDGYSDLKNGILRAIGDAKERFKEDALRMLRACRFAAKLNFTIEKSTFNAICDRASSIKKVSAERIKDELFSILSSSHPAKGIDLMRESKLLSYIIPELEWGIGCEQLGFHDKDVYTHILLTVQAAADASFPLSVRLAALFHDIAKPLCRAGNEEVGYTFYNHDTEGERLTREILLRLKCSNEEINHTALLVREHMFNYTPNWSDSAVRRFILRVGVNNIKDLFLLRLADMKAISGRMDFTSLEELDSRIRVELEKQNALSVKDLLINGNDLLSMGLKGPIIGETLNYLLDNVIEDPSLNERSKLIELAKKFILLNQAKLT